LADGWPMTGQEAGIMSTALSTKQLRALIADLARPSTPIALAFFLGDMALHFAFLAGAVLFQSWPLKLACALAAGTWSSRLFVIAHDGAHGSLTASKRLNDIIAHVAFLPCMHNVSLWRIAHNKFHHKTTSVQGLNSWWPLSKGEYDRLPVARKLLYRFYRTPIGIGPYYLVERWWKDKFFPTLRMVGRHSVTYWADFALVMAYVVVWLGLLVAASLYAHAGSLPAVLFWGFVLPHAMFCYLVGTTVYLQHTHERLPWYRNEGQLATKAQAEVTAQIRVPYWYTLLSHNSMEHTAHHVNQKIPFWRLRPAQVRLNAALGPAAVTSPFGLVMLWRTMRQCKLYDYEHRRWLDYDGRPTSEPVAGWSEAEAPAAA
jgi:omega-6 fatty acid desaturase (delta-12 desaturase)